VCEIAHNKNHSTMLFSFIKYVHCTYTSQLIPEEFTQQFNSANAAYSFARKHGYEFHGRAAHA